MSTDDHDDAGQEPERPSLFKDPAAGRPPASHDDPPASSSGWAPPARGRGPAVTPPAPPVSGGWAPPSNAAGGFSSPGLQPHPQTQQDGRQEYGGHDQQRGPVLQLASYGDRVAAALVDLLVRIGIVMAFGGVGAVLFLAGEDAGIVGLLCGLAIGYLVSGLVYPPVMMARTNGQTLGHRATGTRVVNADLAPMTGGKAFIREGLVKTMMFDWSSGFFLGLPALVNYLFPLWDEGNETLHDKICSTRVIRD